MSKKAQYYARIAEQTAIEVTSNYQNWTNFLTTAARLYKYPYHEQIMIYAQRPDATACADYDTWKQDFSKKEKPCFSLPNIILRRRTL